MDSHCKCVPSPSSIYQPCRPRTGAKCDKSPSSCRRISARMHDFPRRCCTSLEGSGGMQPAHSSSQSTPADKPHTLQQRLCRCTCRRRRPCTWLHQPYCIGQKCSSDRPQRRSEDAGQLYRAQTAINQSINQRKCGEECEATHLDSTETRCCGCVSEQHPVRARWRARRRALGSNSQTAC